MAKKDEERNLSELLKHVRDTPMSDSRMIAQELLHCFGGSKAFARYLFKKLSTAKPDSMMETRLLEKCMEMIMRSAPKETMEDDLAHMTEGDVRSIVVDAINKNGTQPAEEPDA